MGKIIQVTPQMKQAVKEIACLAKGSRDYFGVKDYLDGYDLSVMKTADAEQIRKLMDNIEYTVEDMRIRSKIAILTDHIRRMTRREEARMPQKTHRNNFVTLPCAIGDLVYPIMPIMYPPYGYDCPEYRISSLILSNDKDDNLQIKAKAETTDERMLVVKAVLIDLSKDFGKTVFFTEEEAKEAIESLELEEQERESEPELE